VIDIRTFMLVLAVGNIGFAVLMAGYARSAADHQALRVWKWAKLVQGTAHLLGWMRPDFPSLWLGAAANTFLILGVAWEVAAYCTFFGFRRWKRLLYPATVCAIVLFHAARLGGASATTMTVLMSCTIALLTGAMAYILLRPGAQSSLLQRIIGLNDLVFFLAMGARAYVGVVHGGLTVFTPNAVQTLTYLTGYLLMIVNGFGFLLLCKEKDDRKMAELATIDSLTGLVNRRAFFEHTERARQLSKRLRQPIALMMLDIDHFKRLNDRFGHAGGDQALCVFAATARAVLREHDIMGRLGGEEFALVLPGTDLEGALQAAERLRLAVEGAMLHNGGQAYSMTVSSGVVLIDPLEHINAALARADHALYAAKSAGRNRVECGESLRRCA
jgi:diguanylate cyclase (GGDEF)-like protein